MIRGEPKAHERARHGFNWTLLHRYRLAQDRRELGRNVVKPGDATHTAMVSANWEGKVQPQWLLTAYEKAKGEPASRTRISVPEAFTRVEPTPSTTGQRSLGKPKTREFTKTVELPPI